MEGRRAGGDNGGEAIEGLGVLEREDWHLSLAVNLRKKLKDEDFAGRGLQLSGRWAEKKVSTSHSKRLQRPAQKG